MDIVAPFMTGFVGGWFVLHWVGKWVQHKRAKSCWFDMMLFPCIWGFIKAVFAGVGSVFFMYLAYYLYVHAGWIIALIMLPPFGWVAGECVLYSIGHFMALYYIITGNSK